MIESVREFFKNTDMDNFVSSITDDDLTMLCNTLNDEEKYLILNNTGSETAMEMVKLLRRYEDIMSNHTMLYEDGSIRITEDSSITELTITLSLYKKLESQGISYIYQLDDAMVTEEEGTLLLSALALAMEDGLYEV